MPRQTGACIAPCISILDTGAAMRESFIRDRTGDDGSAAGAVDNSVVNWLMHVISGKAPTQLGLNDAPEADAGAGEPSRQKKLTSRDVTKESSAPSSPSMDITAADLCGAPVVPMTPGPVAYEPIVYEVVTDEELASEKAVLPPVESPVEVTPEPTPEPEWRGVVSFKRPTGPQLVDTGRAQVLPPATNQALAMQLMRDEVPYEAPPASEVTRSIASSLRAGIASTSETAAEPIDPLDLVRDPDYYEEKLRAREAEKTVVDSVPPEPAAPVSKAAPVMEEEPDLVQVVRHEAPVAAVPVAEAAPAEATQVVAAAPVEGKLATEAMPVAAIAVKPVVPEVAKVLDPFAGIEFGATAAPEEQASSEAPVAPRIPDPFAGVEFGAGPESERPVETVIPAAVETAPEVAAAVPEAPVIAPEPEMIAAAPEAGEVIPFAENVAVMPEPVAEPVVEAVVEPVVEVAATQAVEPLVEAAPAPEVQAEPEAHAEPEVVEVAPVAESAATTVEAVAEHQAKPEAEAEAVAEPAMQVAPAVTAMPAVIDPFAGIDFGVEPVAVEAPEPTFAEAAAEAVAAPMETEAGPEVVAAPVPEVVVPEDVPEVAPEVEAAEPEVAEVQEEPEVVAAVAEATEVSDVVAETEVEPADDAVSTAPDEVPADEDVAAEAEAPVRSWSWMVPEAPPVMPEVAARAAWDADRKPTEDIFQPPTAISQPVKAVAEACVRAPGEAKPEDLSAAIKTLMQLGSVLPLAARMAPREGETVQEPVAVDSQEVKQEVSGLRLLQYEIKTTVQDQSMHLKRLEDQLARLRESAEMDSAESASAMDNMKSTAKMVRVMGIGLGVMLMVLILLIGMVLMHVK
jgi:hypothetical protein